MRTFGRTIGTTPAGPTARWTRRYGPRSARRSGRVTPADGDQRDARGNGRDGDTHDRGPVGAIRRLLLRRRHGRGGLRRHGEAAAGPENDGRGRRADATRRDRLALLVGHRRGRRG